MKRLILAAVIVLAASATVFGQSYLVPVPTAVPVTAYYAPLAPVPATTYAAPTPCPCQTPAPVVAAPAAVWVPGPVMVAPAFYPRPVIVRPRIFVPGQPVRNTFRAIF